jgi:hypothetical protein
MSKDVYISAGIVMNIRHVEGENISDKDIAWYESRIGQFPTKENALKRIIHSVMHAGLDIYVHQGRLCIFDPD